MAGGDPLGQSITFGFPSATMYSAAAINSLGEATWRPRFKRTAELVPAETLPISLSKEKFSHFRVPPSKQPISA